VRRGSPQRIDPFDPGWLLGIVLLAAVLALPGCGSSSGEPTHGQQSGEDEQKQEDDAIAVRVESVSRAPITALYGTSASLRADKQAVVTARTSGVVRSLLVEEGDIVFSGQALARLEDDEQQIEFDKAVTTRDTTWREYERALSLHEQGLLSEEEFETARREAEESKQSAALAELTLSRTLIRAPFGGSILRRHVDVGATVADGTAVFDIADLDPLYADVNVPERHISRLAVGQQVRLAADSSGAVARARIERIAPLVEPTSGTVKVTLAVSHSAGMRPGSFVRVEIVTDTHDDALVVPRSALVAEGRRWYLFRLSPDGENVERLQVTRGYEERDRVEIAGPANGSSELAEGDRVVVTGASALTDGARIQIVEPGAEDEEEQAQERTPDEDEQSGVGS
jgi:membrane fusion protein (multidrug efflux system)